MDRVLVLNASFEPLSLISVKRAVILLLTDKAEVVEQDVARQLHAERVAIDVPLVIRLVRYITIPRGMRVPLSRKTLLARDEHTCQYCGKSGVPLTVEHLQPRTRYGGGTETLTVSVKVEHWVVLAEARGNDAFRKYIV